MSCLLHNCHFQRTRPTLWSNHIKWLLDFIPKMWRLSHIVWIIVLFSGYALVILFFRTSAEDLPALAQQDDRIIEIQGQPEGVHKAVELTASFLRKFLVDHSVLPLFENYVSIFSSRGGHSFQANSTMILIGHPSVGSTLLNLMIGCFCRWHCQIHTWIETCHTHIGAIPMVLHQMLVLLDLGAILLSCLLVPHCNMIITIPHLTSLL